MDVEVEGEAFCGSSVIDIEYEFDAPRYFELGKHELPPEVQKVDLWFETAGNYPPAPLLANNTFDKEGKKEIVGTLFEIWNVESFNAQMGVCAVSNSFLCGSMAGSAYNAFPQQVLPKDNKPAAIEGACSGDSCFLKTTTNHLVIQDLVQLSSTRRFQNSFSTNRSSEDLVHTLHHAAKRQKVAGGVVCKLTKMKLTNPREPVLETMRRANNFRVHRSKHFVEKETSAPSFKALPLNQKILEAPSLSFPRKSIPKLPEFQEFKLATSERAILRSLATTTPMIMDNHASRSTVKQGWTNSKKSEYYPFSFSKRAMYDKKTMDSTLKLKGLNYDEKI